jgi:CarD family transcriptional regulator
MEFQVGDLVFHPVHGVGHIVGIAKKEFVQDRAQVYYEITTSKSTVWMPIDASHTIGLRRITAKRDLGRYRTVLKSRPARLDNDHGKRRLYLLNQLKEGSLRIVCEVVRDLTARGWRNRLTQMDTSILRKAREELDQEWAAAAGVSLEDATQEIDNLLQDGQRRYA